VSNDIYWSDIPFSGTIARDGRGNVDINNSTLSLASRQLRARGDSQRLNQDGDPQPTQCGILDASENLVGDGALIGLQGENASGTDTGDMTLL
jgi:hypothetical protein